MPAETDISPMEMSSLDMCTVDEELADLAVDLVLLSQELVNTKLKLQHFTKTGWMEMAKARYIMGPNSVSSLQLPVDTDREVLATNKIFTNECLRGEGKVRYNYFSVSDPAHSDLDLPEGVRLRRAESGSGVEEVPAAGQIKPEDPIRWFGFMPPLPLKLSQKCFSSGVETVVEIANIQSEIRGVQDRIKFLNRIRDKDGAMKDKDEALKDKDGAIKDKDVSIKDEEHITKNVASPNKEGALGSKDGDIKDEVANPSEKEKENGEEE